MLSVATGHRPVNVIIVSDWLKKVGYCAQKGGLLPGS